MIADGEPVATGNRRYRKIQNMTSHRREFTGFKNLPIVADCFGDPTHPPVLLMHGGGQTRHAWRGTAAALAGHGFYAIAYDARGHGDSGWATDGDYTLEAIVGDLLAITQALAPKKPILVGASLGGFAALLAYGEHGKVASAVVLVDIATRLESKGIDKILAFMRAHPEGFASLDEAADTIAAYLPHRPRPKTTKGLEKNLRKGDDGRWRWHWDPAFMSIGDQKPRSSRDPNKLENAARKLTVPTLLVRGGSSDVVSEESVKVFLEQVPHAEYADVAGAQHMVAGDKNDAFTVKVIEFLERHRNEVS